MAHFIRYRFLTKDIETISAFFRRKGVQVVSPEDLLQVVRHLGYEEDQSEDARHVMDMVLEGQPWSQAIEGTSYGDKEEDEEGQEGDDEDEGVVLEHVSWEGRKLHRRSAEEEQAHEVTASHR